MATPENPAPTTRASTLVMAFSPLPTPFCIVWTAEIKCTVEKSCRESPKGTFWTNSCSVVAHWLRIPAPVGCARTVTDGDELFQVLKSRCRRAQAGFQVVKYPSATLKRGGQDCLGPPTPAMATTGVIAVRVLHEFRIVLPMKSPARPGRAV